MSSLPPTWRRRFLTLGLLCQALVCATAASAEIESPLTPGESLRVMQVEPGLKVELVACEPEVIDPIAIRFDEDGRLWVVEMRDYPHGPAEGQPPLSTIRVLTDNDADGRYETSRVFAEHLLFPTGIQPWQGGVFVTLAGAVAYLKDTDGDGRADHEQTWYRGFATENPQLRANHPRLGLDGRIYIANGLRGGAVVDAREQAPGDPLSISGRDFCFDPRSGTCEAISGNGQFGLALDDFGNRFVCNNRAPLQHVVLENRYLERNPFLAVASVTKDVAPAGELSRVFPLTAAWTTSNLHAGQFTAACGVEIYRGDLLGAAHRGNAFVCEPTGSLVHREVLAADGVSFTSHPAYEGREFLASRDPWFRPVNLEIGPDGALYVVDMYRAVIEHPQFMPSELQKRPDMRLGEDRGRIYRVVPADKNIPRPAPKLSTEPPERLVERLQHENAWWRDTAARLLVERREQSVAGALVALVESKSPAPSRVQALSLLAVLDALDADLLAQALADDDPRIRELAVTVAEPRLESDDALGRAVISLAADTDARVRFRVALAVGGLPLDDAAASLAAIALKSPGDRWTRDAVAAAFPVHIGPTLRKILEAPELPGKPHNAPEIALVRDLATVLGASRNGEEINRLLHAIGDDRRPETFAAREAALLGLARGLERRGTAFDAFVEQLPDGHALAAGHAPVFERARTAAADEHLDPAARGIHLDLLKYDRGEPTSRVLTSLVARDASQTIRAQAATALTGQADPAAGPALIATYPEQSPLVRRAILDALIANAARAALLLDEVEAGRIARHEIDSARANRLTHHADEAVRKRAVKLLTVAVPAERQAVLSEYRQALALEADPLAGKELFRQHCSTCHHVAGIGVDVAPDISDSRVKTPEQLLTDILNPNQAIDNNYASYTVVMHDGNVHTGIIAAETASSITLRQPENKTVELLRTDVEAIHTSGQSLMPEGFEKQLSKQQMADVISFVKNWRYLGK